MKPLVSIITPCYNGELYIKRFLDSILNQTYPNIELFIVNDGSTDKTEEFILNYKPKFESKGYSLTYIYQKNAGQSAAINKVLPIFHGKYMTWPDSDDYLPTNAIEKKVEYMEENPDIGLCICNVKVVEFGTDKVLGEQKRIHSFGDDNLFVDLILGRNVFYSPGGYMVRSSMFREAMPSMQIQAPREIGQNYQLLLPIAYNYPHGYIDEYLYYYTIRTNSHSHIRRPYEERMHIIKDVSYNVLINIINSIETSDEKLYDLKRLVKIHCLEAQLNVLLQYDRKDNIINIKKELIELGGYDKICAYKFKLITNPIYKNIIKIKNFIIRIYLKLVR